MDRNRCAREGFTLLEVMISVALLAIVALYMGQSFMTQNRAYVVIDQVAESQQGLRAVADLLERDIRHAGMMVPEFAAVCGLDRTNNPDILYVSDASAIDPGDDLFAYDGPQVQGVVANVPAAPAFFTMTLDSLIVEPGAPARAAYDTDTNGVNDSDFQVNGGVIVVDLLDSTRGVACGRVDTVNLGLTQVRIQLATPPLTAAGGVVQLVAIPAHLYSVTNNRLFRNGTLLSQGFEDLQVAYLFDLDGDNLIAANEIRGVTGSNYVPAAVDHSLVRHVRINLVSRTRAEDVEFGIGQFQAMENRVAPAGNDGFRRRVQTSTQMVRNVGNRV